MVGTRITAEFLMPGVYMVEMNMAEMERDFGILQSAQNQAL